MQLSMAWMSISAFVHNEDDDRLCNPVVVLHDHSAHHIGAAAGTSGPAADHCFICHNLSLRSLVATASFATPVAVAQPVAQMASLVAGVTLVERRPARAPPLA